MSDSDSEDRETIKSSLIDEGVDIDQLAEEEKKKFDMKEFMVDLFHDLNKETDNI